MDLGCDFIEDTNIEKFGGVLCKKFIPITITGSVTIERSLNGLRTIYSGHPWWKGMPGTINLEKIDHSFKISSSWLKPNKMIMNETFDFLENVLSKKTLINSPGIGVDGIESNEINFNKFKTEFNNLLFKK